MATKPAVKSEVQVVEPFSMAERPDYIKNDGPARGSEEVGVKDVVLPRLEIVQSESPIRKNDETGAVKEGMLFNSVTSEVYGPLVYFTPVYYRMEYLVWKDQEEGGGFFGAYLSEAEAKQRRADVIAGGERDEFIEVVDTPVHYGFLVDPAGKCEQIVISMAKSKSKVSRKWNAMIQIAGGDRFSRVYKITTFQDKNKKDKTFQNFVVMPAGYAPKLVYDQAEQLYGILKTQDFRAAHDTVIDNESDRPEGTSSDRGGI